MSEGMPVVVEGSYTSKAARERFGLALVPKGWQRMDGRHATLDAVMAVHNDLTGHLRGRVQELEENGYKLFNRDRDAEGRLTRFHARHTPHSCARHSAEETPVPCAEAGLCGCGRMLPCPELAAMDAPLVFGGGS